MFLASPGDVDTERHAVRDFFTEYNRKAERRGVRFQVVDWENYSTIGVGRPQELITKQTLERYRNSLALVIGLMAQRFGTRRGEAEVAKLIQRLRRKPRGGARLSYAAIANRLNAEGVPTRTGRPWAPETVRGIVMRAARRS